MGSTQCKDLPMAAPSKDGSAIKGRHWTADSRRRHGLHTDNHCYLCDQDPKTIDHIVASCSFSRQVWWTVVVALKVNASQIGDETLLAWWDRWWRRWHGERQRGAETLFALVAWEIWKE